MVNRMVGRSQARIFIISSSDEIKELFEKGYTLKEIHKLIPNLKNNIHYSTFVRNIPKLKIIPIDQSFDQEQSDVNAKNENLKNLNSTTKETFVNENSEASKNSGSNISNAQKNREKLERKKEGFSYDHSTSGKDLI